MRVLVVDDHPLFRDGIISLLEAAGFEVVGQAQNGQEALDLTHSLDPDLVLMDISMPEMTGLQALEAIKADQPDIQVVMLTVSEDDEDLLAAVQAGASGYLLKNLDADQFLELLSGLQQGEAAMTRKTTARLIAGVAARAAQPQEDEVRLTKRELELLHLVAEGFSNKAIGQRLSVSENTVKYHMRNILQKMQVQNRAEAVHVAMQAGWITSKSG
jgi:DNA-binding NarL/FixJ family response regulator